MILTAVGPSLHGEFQPERVRADEISKQPDLNKKYD